MSEYYFDKDRIKEKEVEKKNTAKKNNLPKWVYVLLTAFLILVIAFSYCFVTGRILLGEDYKAYQEYQTSFAKYNAIREMLDKEALGYPGKSDKVNPTKVSDDVYVKLMKSLDDPYAEYYTKKEFESFERNFAESYDGVGVVIGDVILKGEKQKRVLVYSVFPDSPAEKAGIKAGDIVLKADGKKVKSSDDTCDHVLGKPGTEVTVTILRDKKEIDYKMKRAKIEEKPVIYKKIDKENKIGYIAVTTFKEGTFDAFQLAVKDLKNVGYNKVIIDLRNNGGGLTMESYKMADYLLPEGIIVTEKDKMGQENVEKSDASAVDLKYVVLVNKQTASASEILSCAIQDNKGGKIIGVKTYGKGVTQKTQKLTDGSALKYTIQEYFRPSGKKVNKVGITPDIIVKKIDDNKVIFEVAKKELLKNGK